MNKNRVFLISTSAESFSDNLKKMIDIAHFQETISKDKTTTMNLEMSCQYWLPSHCTSPWLLETMISYLLSQGYPRGSLRLMLPSLPGVNTKKGLLNNKITTVLKSFDLEHIPISSSPVKNFFFHPLSKINLLDKLFPKGIPLPEQKPNQNLLLLSPLRTHPSLGVHAGILSSFPFHHTFHSAVPDKILLDWLIILKEFYQNIFSIIDTSFSNGKKGKSTMALRDTLIAGADPISVDAVGAALLGFNPLSIRYLRLAHESGLGCADIKKISLINQTPQGKNFAMTKFFPQRALTKNLLSRRWSFPFGLFFLKIQKLFFFHFLLQIFSKEMKRRKAIRNRAARALETQWGKLYMNAGLFKHTINFKGNK